MLGATGKLGTMLRRFWTLENTLWQAQRPIPGVQDCDILRDSVGLAALLSKADIALCLAWTLNTKGGTFGTNLALTQAILHATPIAAHLFFASSAAIYGDNTSCLHETSPLDPRTEYARVKVAVEACAGASSHRTTCLRIRNVAGCDAILGGWYLGMTVEARGLKTPSQSYVGPQSFAKTICRLLTLPARPSLHVAAPGCAEMRELLNATHLTWQPRAPSRDVIWEGNLNIRLLQEFMPLEAREGISADWHAAAI